MDARTLADKGKKSDYERWVSLIMGKHGKSNCGACGTDLTNKPKQQVGSKWYCSEPCLSKPEADKAGKFNDDMILRDDLPADVMGLIHDLCYDHEGRDSNDYKKRAQEILSSPNTSQWVTITDDPGTLPEPTGTRKWYFVSDGERVDVALLLKKSFMGHALQFSAVKYWREIGPLPSPPKADSSLTK